MQQRPRIIINAAPSCVWEALTNPGQVKQWMGEPEMGVELETSWVVGAPILVSGFHHTRFENKGTVLRFEPPKLLRYTHLSSLSRLVDKPENYQGAENGRDAPFQHPACIY
ncbi:MAG: SRPBCC domain-containing protein [Deltaproteobacteria bacterium]|nr:SRPBCC domain-containing protein [Deltaproteobacteria bacterium]